MSSSHEIHDPELRKLVDEILEQIKEIRKRLDEIKSIINEFKKQFGGSEKK